MTNEQAEQTMREGFEFLLSQARLIAMLPLEDWLQALNRSETIGAITDPTLMRDYLHSNKPKVLKAIIKAAIPLKAAVVAAQPLVVREMAKEMENQ